MVTENQNEIKRGDGKGQQPVLKGIADVVIVIDVTGSMYPCLTGLKNELNSFVDNLVATKTNEGQELDWRVRILPFRDLDDEEDKKKGLNPLDNSNPFVNDSTSLRTQINNLEANGGGDDPESQLDALYVAVQDSEWRPTKCHKFIILFTDAPPKDRLNPTTVETGELDTYDTIVQLINKHKIKLWMVVPKHPTYQTLGTIPRAKILAEVANAEGLKDIDFKSFLAELAKTISKESEEVTPA